MQQYNWEDMSYMGIAIVFSATLGVLVGALVTQF